MQPLIAAVSNALEAMGLKATPDAALEGRSGTVYTIPLLLEHDGDAFIADVHTDGQVPEEAQLEIATIADDVGADGAVLMHLASAASTDAGVILWGRDDLVRLLGGAALHEATGVEVDLPPLRIALDSAPVAQSLDQLLPPAFQAKERPELDLAALEGMDDGMDAPDAAGESLDFMDFDALGDGFADLEPEPAVPDAAPPAAVTPFAHPLLPVRVAPAEAMAAVRERLFEADRVERILQPVHLFDYECDLLAEGSLRYDTVSGRIQVHGTDKTSSEVAPEVVDPTGFDKAVPDVPASERTLRVSDDRAKQLGRAFLTEAHTRMVAVSVHDSDGSFDYVEKKKVAPQAEHVRLHHLGVFHRVLWRVRGPNGHIDIDAITGERVEEVLRSPNPDVYIMD